MKTFLCSVPIFALLFASCSAPNNTTVVNNAATPTIVGFSPDTAWTLKQITVYGSHFGFDSADVNATIGGVQTGVANADDTVLTLNVADSAQTGFIHVVTINGSATSVKPLTVKYTFNPHSIAGDTAFEGASFSISGGGMKNYHGFIVLRVGGFTFPIDFLFDNRIVSHVIPGVSSGEIIVSDSVGTYDCGPLYIARPSVWNTLSEIWDTWRVLETHHRVGFIKGPSVPIDSSWIDTVTYSRQNDIKISGIPFIRSGEWLEFDLKSPDFDYPYLRLDWDTLQQSENLSFTLPAGTSLPDRTLMLDTSWNFTTEGVIFPLQLPVDRDIELSFSNGMAYQILEDSTDEAGLVNWQETTYATPISGNFDLIFKK